MIFSPTCARRPSNLLPPWILNNYTLARVARFTHLQYICSVTSSVAPFWLPTCAQPLPLPVGSHFEPPFSLFVRAVHPSIRPTSSVVSKYLHTCAQGPNYAFTDFLFGSILACSLPLAHLCATPPFTSGFPLNERPFPCFRAPSILPTSAVVSKYLHPGAQFPVCAFIYLYIRFLLALLLASIYVLYEKQCWIILKPPRVLQGVEHSPVSNSMYLQYITTMHYVIILLPTFYGIPLP